jgi:hypothetical protein
MNKKILAIAAFCCLHLVITLLLGDIFETETSMQAGHRPTQAYSAIKPGSTFEVKDGDIAISEDVEELPPSRPSVFSPNLTGSAHVAAGLTQRRSASSFRNRNRNPKIGNAEAGFSDTVIFVQTKGKAEIGRTTGPKVHITDHLDPQRTAPSKEVEQRRALPSFTKPAPLIDSLVSKL